MSWPVRIATLAKGGADALHGVQVQAARSPGRTFFRNGLRRSTALTDVATVTRATTAWGVDQGGNVASFAAGQPVVNTAGLAVYEARTNLVVRSQELDLWTTLNASVVANATTAPDGTLNADKIVEDATATVQHGVYKAFTAVAGQPYTASFFAKAAERSWFYMTEADNVTAQASFNLATGKVGTVSGTGSPSATITPLANGWYRCSLTFTPIATIANIQARANIADGGASYTGDGVSGLYAWGAQAEAGASASPYIPTTTAPVTRNADVITEAVNIPVGQSFTVTGKVVAPQLGGIAGNYPKVFDLADVKSGTSQNRIFGQFDSSGFNIGSKSAGAAQAEVQAGAWTPGALVGLAVSVSGALVTASVNGAAPVSLTMGGGPLAAALIRLGLGCNYAGTGQQLNSTIRDLNIIMRASSAAELQAASDVTLTHDIDFVSQVYQYVGAPYVTPTDLPGTTFSRASEALSADAAGQWCAFASGALRVTSAGCFFGEGTTNKCTNYNAAPTNLTNVTKSGDAAATLTVVDDTAALRAAGFGALIDAGKMNGKVYKLDNSAGSTNAFARTTASMGNTNPHTVSAFVRGAASTIDINVGSGIAVSFGASATYVRRSGSGTPSLDGPWRIKASPGDIVYFILNQLEEKAYATNPVIVAGAAATRNTDALASASDTNPTAYTVVAEFTIPTLGPTTAVVWQWDDGTANNKSLLYYNRSTGRLYCQVYTGGVIQANLDLGAVTAGTSYKVALRTAANDFAASLGGSAVVTDTSGTVPTTNAFRLGVDIPGAGGEWSGYIRRIRRYNTGKTNSELQALAA